MRDNTVTFSSPTLDSLSWRCPLVVVTVAGEAAPWLELVELTRREGSRLNEARFRVVGHPLGRAGRFEDVATAARPGQRITAEMVCQSGPVGRRPVVWPLFAGVIVEGSAQISGKAEAVEIIARDEPAWGEGEVVDGMRALTEAGESEYVRSGEVIFNPEGRGNCSAAAVAGGSYYVFDTGPAGGRCWSVAKAIGYIAGEYLAGIELVGVAGLAGAEDENLLRDVEISGLSALAALERICERAGLGFATAYVPTAAGEVKTVLEFYRLGAGREVFLRHQRAGEKLELGRTNVASGAVKLARPRQTNCVIGRGDIKRFESTFELAHGWDSGLEVGDFNLYSPSTNDEFVWYRDVFRKWVLNETGEYSGGPYYQGQAYDLSGVLGTAAYQRSRRRFRPSLSRNPAGESFGYYVEVSYDDGATWYPYGGAFNILLEECGIYLSGNQLDSDVWVAICKDVLKFRITCSVDADEAVEATLYDGPINCSRGIRRKIIDLGRGYQYRQVTAGSIFYQSDTIETGPADATDDTEKIRGQLRRQLLLMRRQEEAQQVELAGVYADIRPGDVAGGISGREVRFGKASEEYRPQVRQVRIELADKWTTTLII